MDVIHIAKADNGNFLVTYMLTEEEFEEIQEQAKNTLAAQVDTQDTD